jgi:hypothetical protein
VRYAVEASDLAGPSTSANLRAVIKLEINRAGRLLLRNGPPLVSSLRGYGRLAVAGFVAGGLATIDALHRADFDVLGEQIRRERRDTLSHLVRLVAGRP